MAVGDVLASYSLSALNPAIGLTFDGTHLWSCDGDGGRVHKIDPADGTVVSSVAINSNLQRVAHNRAGQMWFYRWSDVNWLFLYSESGAFVRQIAAPDDDTAGLDYHDGSLWLTDEVGRIVYELDPADGTVLSSFPGEDELGGQLTPGVITHDGTNLWVSEDGAPPTIYQVDPAGGPALSSFDSPDNFNVRGITFDGTNLWLITSNNNTLYKLEGPQYNQPPNAPAWQTPQNQVFATSTDAVLDWIFSDADAGDTQSEYVLDRWALDAFGVRVGPATRVVTATPVTEHIVAGGSLAAGDYEFKVATRDAAGAPDLDAELVFSESLFVTFATPPPGPTFLDPIDGQTIATASYEGTISAPNVDESEWTLYGDNAGVIETATVVQGPELKTIGDLRSHEFTGLTNNVPVWWSVRIKHEGLWSEPAQIRTPVSYTPPPAPSIALSVVDAAAAIDVAITNPAPGVGEPAVTHNEVWIDDGEGFERRAAVVAVNSTWRYHTPISGRDYSAAVRVVAVGDNGAAATTTGASA